MTAVSNTLYYNQCEIGFVDDKTIITAWLPRKFAKDAKRLEIGGRRALVLKVYQPDVSIDFLNDVRAAQQDRASTIR